MLMNKDWINLNRATNEYMEGAWNFVKAVERNEGYPKKILCPCKNCMNLSHQCVDEVYEHLVIKGMDPTYRIWVHHGEKPAESQLQEDWDIRDTYNLYMAAEMDGVNMDIGECEGSEKAFNKDLEDAATPLYEGCTKHTKLSAIVALYKLKNVNGWSDTSFTGLLELLHDLLPEKNVLLKSMYLVKRFLRRFDLKYDKIDACLNDCCLFRGGNAKLDTCPKCKTSRWKQDKHTKEIKVGEPAKVLRYFPIIPRLKRMFRSKEMAESLRWHSNNKSNDGKMRHPVDSIAWGAISDKWPEFNIEPRNLRLGLATDGINPYKNLSSTYSCWPVMVVVYNLSPLLCMKDEYTFLTLLIPGPRQPGNDIDIYLEPLIDELKELWNIGVLAYDAFEEIFFNLKAMLLWTINDFPAYGNLAGCTTKGKTACPICGEDTSATWLSNSSKFSYQQTRRFLPHDHPYRSKKSWFNGKEERRGPPTIMTGPTVAAHLQNFENDFGKHQGKKRRRDNELEGMWKKRSIFFELPYWEVLVVRHNLDVMHIEKNVCESIVSTLLQVKGKSKDHLNARLDLEEMGLKSKLHPIRVDGVPARLPAAPYTLSKSDRKLFCKRLFDLKLPDGYSSNIANCVSIDQCKLMGLKSHDCHVLMQQLLSVSIRGLMEDGPRVAILRLCKFFNGICQRVIDRDEILELENEVVETLCMFERYFPPSFFDPMVHLVVHLGREVRLCGPVQFRWMYHFERYMKILKGYVMQPAHPEGSIAERYLADESMRFCAIFLNKVTDVGSKVGRNEYDDNDVILEGRPLYSGKRITLNDKDLASAHKYVLFNLAMTESFLEMHLEVLKVKNKTLKQSSSLLWKRHSEQFPTWFQEKVQNSENLDNQAMLRRLAHGPRREAISYKGYVINGQRFHTKEAERKTQNSGVFLEATTMCRASAKDNTQLVDVLPYYGVIKEIILLDYYTFHIPLFRCNWANIVSGVKKLDWYTLVNLHQGQNASDREPFILTSQAKKVFYVRESEKSNWYIVLHVSTRGFPELESSEEENDHNQQQGTSNIVSVVN